MSNFQDLLDFSNFQICKAMSKNFDELTSVMAQLRAPGGCPWDAEQTYASLAQYLLEESYEAFDAIYELFANGFGEL